MEIVNWIRKNDEFLVVGHIDADGITSTAIMVKALERLGKDVEFLNLKQLYREDIERLVDSGKKIIFVDMGSGQLKDLRGEFAVVDHHVPLDVDHPLEFNAWKMGWKGDREISGAGMAYLVARELGDNSDLSILAVVGAVGDMQAPLTGKNREILRDAISSGLMVYRDAVLYGRYSRPLVAFLTYTTNPVIPGVSGNEEGALRLLNELGLDPLRIYAELGMEEKRRLITRIVEIILDSGDIEGAKKVVGEVYDLDETVPYLKSAREFSTLLNACGRHGHAEVGVRIAMGDRGRYLEEGLRLLSRHREALKRGMEVALERMEDMGAFYFFHGKDKILPEVVGTVAGMVLGSLLLEKPVVGAAYDNGWVKVSIRVPGRSKINAAEVIRRACEVVGGEGGGHRMAAGARIPLASLEEFLKILSLLLHAPKSSSL